MTTLQIAALSGLTLRKLQWLDEKKIIYPDRVQGSREYSTEQAIEALLLKAMRDKGMTLKRAHWALQRFRKLRRPVRYMIVCDHIVHFEISDAKLVQYCTAASGPVLIFDLVKIEQRLRVQ